MLNLLYVLLEINFPHLTQLPRVAVFCGKPEGCRVVTYPTDACFHCAEAGSKQGDAMCPPMTSTRANLQDGDPRYEVRNPCSRPLYQHTTRFARAVAVGVAHHIIQRGATCVSRICQLGAISLRALAPSSR